MATGQDRNLSKPEIVWKVIDMEIDYFKEENELTKKLFDLDEIISFQMEHDVQIIRGADWQYMCYIDKKGFGSGLTTMGALVIGIKQFKDQSFNGG
jgi:hypothetical protein